MTDLPIDIQLVAPAAAALASVVAGFASRYFVHKKKPSLTVRIRDSSGAQTTINLSTQVSGSVLAKALKDEMLRLDATVEMPVGPIHPDDSSNFSESTSQNSRSRRTRRTVDVDEDS